MFVGRDTEVGGESLGQTWMLLTNLAHLMNNLTPQTWMVETSLDHLAFHT